MQVKCNNEVMLHIFIYVTLKVLCSCAFFTLQEKKKRHLNQQYLIMYNRIWIGFWILLDYT